MGVFCKNCSKYSVSITDALAYSAGDGGMWCKACGAELKVPKIVGILYLLIEGVSVLICLICSILLYSIWPLILISLLLAVLRVFVLPLMAQVKRSTSTSIFRLKK